MHNEQTQLVKTARITGIWYLLMAISGILGFMVLHPRVFVADAQETLTNLTEKESLARMRILAEFVIVVSQALTAIWFYKLFKKIDAWAASSIAFWGTVNAVVILFSAIAMGAAVQIANATEGVDNPVPLIELLSRLSSNAWGAGGLFFGLWLLPIGYIVVKSKRMPVWLGRVLVLGGIGYLIGTFISYSGIDFEYNSILVLPATVGEFWMIGYLLIFGIRPENDL